MAREMKLATDLQPEQLDVLNKATAPNPNEFIFVQGVAGSGKTTIALNIALKVGELNINRPVESRQTILFLTYNDRLAEYCRNTLANKATITQMIAPNRNGMMDGYINVMTVSDLFRLSIHLNDRGKFIGDEDCINYLARAAAQRGILDLLPSQIFALITTFLRGRPELSDKSIEELNEIIERDMHRSVHYRMYGDSLQNIRHRLLGTYEDWKRVNKGIDRADVAKSMHDQIQEIEGYLAYLPELQAEYLRKISRRNLGDGDPIALKTLKWLEKAFAEIQDIPKYEKSMLEFRSILASQSVKQEELQRMLETLYSSILDVGLRATPVWDAICSHLRNPLIIVDEIQDLSQIECENLVSLWLQMSRKHESHLILLGDLNQQITPSGFEWRTLHELVQTKSIVYQHTTRDPDHHDLSNNYRTTDEIAGFVHAVMKNVAPKALADQEIADRFLKYSIDPKATLAINLEEKMKQIKADGGDLVPHVLVGSNDLFKKGIDQYVRTLQEQGNPAEMTDKILSTVIITEHGSQVDDLISKDLAKYVLDNDLIEVIPVLSCKGLEFDRCVLHGLSIKEIGEIEQDLISRWYTSFTRAKLQLLIYLTEKEFGYIQQLGWEGIPADVVLVKRVNSLDDIAKELEQLGKTDLDDEARYHIAEASLSRFIQTGNEDHLKKSLRLLNTPDLVERMRKNAWQGADWFEKQSNYIKAANYFHEATSPVDEVRCLALHANKLSLEGVPAKETKLYLERAIQVTEDAPDSSNQAKCWVLLQDYEKALKSAEQTEDNNLQQEIASQVADAIMRMSSNEPENAAVYAELLEEMGFREAAALSWLSLSQWNKAFECAARMDKRNQEAVVSHAVGIAREMVKKHNPEAGRIAEKLDQNRNFEDAADIWIQIRNIPAAVQSLVSAGQVERAENLIKAPENRTDGDEKKQIYSILAKGFRKDTRTWHRAYDYFYLADMKDECRRLEQECRVLEDYRTLADCYNEIGDTQKLVELANELELKNSDNKGLIAECWQKAGEWERAANAWMKMFFSHIERSEELFGPNPDRLELHPNSQKRFNQNVENNLTEYQLLLPEWENLSRYTSNMKQYYANTAKIVEMISQSAHWQEQAAEFLRSLREQARSAAATLSEGSARVRIPEKIKPSTADEVADIWQRITTANTAFQLRAVELCRDCYKKSDKLLAIRLMYGVCTWKDEAIKMSDDLASRDTDLWIKSWKMLEYSNDTIERKIFSLHPTNQAKIIRQAIFEIYQDNQKRREALWEKYRNRLIAMKGKKAQEILVQYFPEFNQPQPDQEPVPEHNKMTNLIKEVAIGLDSWSLHEGDRIELSAQLESMKEILPQPERLAAKWKMAKSLIPETLDRHSQVKVDQLDKLIRATQAQEPVIPEPLVDYSEVTEVEDEEIPKPRNRSRHRHKAQPQPHRILQQIDLHERSLEDAKRDFEATFDAFCDDKTIGALLVVHGYGKDKNKSVIKEWLHTRVKRLKGHRCVRCIIKGEEIIDQFGKQADILRASVDEVDFSKIGVNTPGYTVIVFNRN